jgi:PKD repeat protein
LPISVTVRNVAPAVQLSVPTDPVAVGTSAPFSAMVTDPGADLMTWQWSFGDGDSTGRSATSVLNRTDSPSHSYTTAGQYTVQVAVADGSDTRTASGQVFVFNPNDRFVGSGTYVADAASIGVPVGSPFAIAAKVRYSKGAVRPSGSLTLSFPRTTGGGRPAAARLEATSFEWVLAQGSGTRVQGSAAVDGTPGWRFLAELSRASRNPDTSRLTVSRWQPGSTSTQPDIRLSGPWKSGNLP